jgi:hypothetical protein
MKKGSSIMRSINIKSILGAACLAALAAAEATAHHESADDRQYLAFWSGYRPSSDPAPTPKTCLENDFWEKGFVSIYSQGAR